MTNPKYVAATFKLKWTPEDFVNYPWLKHSTRYYSLGKHLGDGAFGRVYDGYTLAHPNSKKRVPKSPKLVVKVPNLRLNDYTSAENRQRLEYIRTKNIKEFAYLRTRLKDSAHANPIIDLASLYDDEHNLELPVTIQLFLDEFLNLDQWLAYKGYCPAPHPHPARGRSLQQWQGVSSRSTWLSVALPIALALKDIHRRRVRHGDIHPGNVFLSIKPQESLATLIDFGEAFLATPDLNWRHRNPVPYLAPERLGARQPLNEQVDVYSFGILLLYLATGTAHQFTHERRIGLHRSHVHELIHKVNPGLVRKEPRVVDIISRSTARDPSDRLRMFEICDDLYQIASSTGDPYPRQDHSSTASLLEQFAVELQLVETRYNPIILNLLDRQVRELANMFAGLQTEMVEMYGTRDQMLRVMVSLMDFLAEGDSWSTATTLSAWQRNALGLNGSYLSANIRAATRGVAIRRTFVVSVEELGLEFSERLAVLLTSATSILKNLGRHFNTAIEGFKAKQGRDNYTPAAPDFIQWHRDRLLRIVQSLHDFLMRWDLVSYIGQDRDIDLRSSTGIYFGLSVVGTLDDVGAKREDNPVSLMHFASAPVASQKWLLVSAEQRGRHETHGGAERPHLLGVRVYKSIMNEDGTPNDRIKYLEKLMNKEAVNITASTEHLIQIVSQAHREV